jgi:hypothetical protein
LNYDGIFNENVSKLDNPEIDTVLIVFPYNQKDLFVPDNEDWFKILQNQKMKNTCLIVSPNSLVRAKPMVANDHLIITVNEMILKYWEEIRDYIIANPNIKCIKIISSDIDIKRVKRDFNIIFFSDFFRKFKIIDYSIVKIRSSFWKTIYKVREKLVLMLPIGLYKTLGKFR